MISDSPYIEVAIALPVYKTFTYQVPKSLFFLIFPGKRVLVPFGRRRVTGYIIGPSENICEKEIKQILDVLDEEPLFPASMIPFFKWISDYYIYPLGEVIKGALPGGINLYDTASIAITKKGEQAIQTEFSTPIEREILQQLKHRSCSLKDLYKKNNKDVPNALIKKMEIRGLITKRLSLKSTAIKPKMQRYIKLIRSDIPKDRFYTCRKKIIDTLAVNGEISIQKLKQLIPESSNFINYMKDAGFIQIYKKETYRDPFGEPITRDIPPMLTKNQENVTATVINSLGKGFKTFLLAGVTGSGKTEVYMHVVAEAVKRGNSALALVPEIALISQVERQFRARFGDCIAVMHSGLSAGERFDQWLRIMRKETAIVIGARSAVFAPLDHIDVIVVDEEHDTSYKQDTRLRYNARDLAVLRAKMQNAVVLLGSATPSVQSYYNVKTKKFIELNLEHRVNKQALPEIDVVDLCKYRDSRGINRHITTELHVAMKETLNRGEQVLLFLNRRGFANFPVCAACGHVMRCKNCDISLTFHQKNHAYQCHFCGFSKSSVSSCRVCGSSKIKLLGVGTEKIEIALKALFPEARVARMDHDTTQRKGALIRILKELRNHKIDILVGTQMVAKGHDFPNITLVGIICADLSLNFPDFRAGERTFQLLSQVAGRAGRGNAPGKVILQTYNPQHFSILSAKDQDFKLFYNQEILYRKALRYPPFSRLIQLKISGKDKDKTEKLSKEIGSQCSLLQKQYPSFLEGIEILGPIQAALPKIAKYYRWQILLKGLNATTLHQFIRQLLSTRMPKFNTHHFKTVVDVDPFFML
ncbi:MAG: primosomal protein N' [Desulfobacterales bacterium]|nr:primosomal protein N' [Desulfobacterales bacterium]